MAYIRQVRRHENSRMWAFIEWSDENPNHFVLLGGQEFQTKEEAEKYSKGFAPFSYKYVEPKDLKREKLISEKLNLQNRIISIDKELEKL